MAIIVMLFMGEVLTGHPAKVMAAASATGVLTIVSALAVGIERVLEGFWTLVDTLAANPGPLSRDAQRLNDFAKQLDSVVRTPLVAAQAFLNEASAEAEQVLTNKPNAQQEIDTLLGSVNAILADQSNPQTWPSLNDLQAGLTRLSAAFANQDLQADLQGAVSGIADLSELVSTLTTNPGRKVLSLMAGSCIGILATWLLGLDVVQAALGQPVADLHLGSPNTWRWGMALTGLVVGLGANPTHELIASLQAYKQNTQAKAKSSGS